MEPGAPWRDPRQGYAYGVGSAVQMPMQLQQRADAATGGGVLKRSLGELERWQHHQQQMAAQQALYMRTVRQRTGSAADIAALLGGTTAAQPLVRAGSSYGGGLASPSSTLSSLTTVSRAAVPLMHPHPQPQPQLQRQVPLMAPQTTQAFALSRALPPPQQPQPQPAASSELFILQELEKQLLDDDDDDEPVPAMSGTGSAVTHSEWEETIQQLNSSITAAAPSQGVPAAATPNTTAANNNNTNAGMTRSPSNSSSSTASSSASCSPPTPGAASRQLLSEAAVAVADGNHEAAATHLAALKRLGNQHGDAEQRLIAMMVAALSSRIAPAAASAPALHLADLCGAEQRAGSQLLHDISPCFRLALHAANVAIVDAVGNCPAIHLVDFDVSYPQHAALVQHLADRRVPGSSLRVTAVTDPSSPFTQSLAASLAAIGEQLTKLAERAGIEYRLKVVSCRAAELDASRLGCEPGEALAVNLAFALSHVPDESVSPANPRDELLRRVRALGPQVVSLVEQELNTNTAPLAARFTDSCAHYGAILESLDATLAREGAEKKARAEAALAQKAANAVGREGPDRLERCEVFGKWRARFGMAGFRPVALPAGIAEQVLASVGPAPPGFAAKQENGVLRLCWMGRVVTVASAWR